MGIKTALVRSFKLLSTLKNLPTTWGLRLVAVQQIQAIQLSLKNLPTTWGLRLSDCLQG